MKKFFLLALLTLFAMSAEAQQKRVYCALTSRYAPFSTKMKVFLDLGETEKAWHNHRLVDENGEKIQFTSLIEALNYMADRGWVLEQSATYNAGQNVVTYSIMSKVIFDESEKGDNVVTKHEFKQAQKAEAEQAPTE